MASLTIHYIAHPWRACRLGNLRSARVETQTRAVTSRSGACSALPASAASWLADGAGALSRLIQADKSPEQDRQQGETGETQSFSTSGGRCDAARVLRHCPTNDRSNFALRAAGQPVAARSNLHD